MRQRIGGPSGRQGTAWARRRHARAAAAACPPAACVPIAAAWAAARSFPVQTKQYKKGIKNADTILKKFPEHGETLAMKVRRRLGRHATSAAAVAV